MSAVSNEGESIKFYNLPLEERLKLLGQKTGLDSAELEVLTGESGLTLEQADHMIENVVGVAALPLGIAQNFIVNGRAVLVPMAIEEPSVVAGASYMARLARASGGFFAYTTPPEMIGQMQILDIDDNAEARIRLLEQKGRLLAEAAGIDPVLQRLGGGPRDVEVRLIEDSPIGMRWAPTRSTLPWRN
jgi:hydroxymethylglutaryl-CoA reductase